MQIVFKMHEFQKQIDYVLLAVSMCVSGVFLTYIIPGGYKLLCLINVICERCGESIIGFFSHLWRAFSWLFSIGLPDSEYSIEFESKLDKLSSEITGIIPEKFIDHFHEDDFAQHGRVYLKLFQISRCMKCHSQNGIIDKENKVKLQSQVDSMESVMRNYRFLSSAQIIQAYTEAAKLKPLFQLL